MKALGEFLRNCLRNDFSPYFIIQEDDAKNVDVIKAPVGENLITDMCLRGSFKLSRIHVYVSKELATTTISLCLSEDSYPYSANSFLPISGFPRELITEDAKTHGTLSHPSNILYRSIPLSLSQKLSDAEEKRLRRASGSSGIAPTSEI